MKFLVIFCVLIFVACSNNSGDSSSQLGSTYKLLSFSTDFSTKITATSTIYNQFVITGDLDKDGLEDVVMGGIDHYNPTAKSPLLVLKNNGDGTITDITTSITGLVPLEFFQPQGHIGDINGDGHNDLIIFDRGYKTRTIDGGYMGGEPALFLSNGVNTQLTYSNSISSAIASYRQTYLTGFSVPPLNCNGAKYYYKWHTDGDCDLFAAGDNALNNVPNGAVHSKYQSLGDVDGDGDLDIFVEAGGGGGNGSYTIFLINGGTGDFTPSWDRVSDVVLKNNVGMTNGTWRHYDNEFVDIDNDGDMDLVMGKLGNKLTSYNFDHDLLRNKILINDGTGNFPDANVIKLPNPAMLSGVNMQHATAASAVISIDINSDGLKDLLFAHTRGTDALALGATSWTSTGRYIQIIVQTSPLIFEDHTSNYISSQSAFTAAGLKTNFPSPYPSVTFSDNKNAVKSLKFVDFDNDGDKDILFQNAGLLEQDTGQVGFINENGNFKAFSITQFQPPQVFYTTGSGLGWVDLNQDGKQDIIMTGPFESTGISNILSGLYIFLQ